MQQLLRLTFNDIDEYVEELDRCHTDLLAADRPHHPVRLTRRTVYRAPITQVFLVSQFWTLTRGMQTLVTLQQLFASGPMIEMSPDEAEAYEKAYLKVRLAADRRALPVLPGLYE